MKIGPNEKCPCGSGLKYKKCCYPNKRGTAAAETPNQAAAGAQQPGLQDFMDILKKGFGRKTCMYPGCMGNKIIQAHTVQKAGGLTAIARDGKVYSGMGNSHGIATGEMPMSLDGVSKASTFTGFCGTHDSTVFLPLETKPFVGSAEQCFLLAYRALCRELYHKIGAASVSEEIANLIKQSGVANGGMAELLSGLPESQKIGRRDMESLKAEYDTVLLSKDYSEVSRYVVYLSNTPNLLCSGSFPPEVGFSGERLQGLKEYADHTTPMRYVTFSVIATATGGAIVFSWADADNRPAEGLVRSFDALPDGEKPDAAVRLAFQHLENVYASPDWWEGLTDGDRESLDRRRLDIVRVVLPPEALRDDGLRTVSWNVSAVETNLPDLLAPAVEGPTKPAVPAA